MGAALCERLLGSLEVWKFGSLEVWRFGGLEVWRFGGLEVWRFGSGAPAPAPRRAQCARPLRLLTETHFLRRIRSLRSLRILRSLRKATLTVKAISIESYGPLPGPSSTPVLLKLLILKILKLLKLLILKILKFLKILILNFRRRPVLFCEAASRRPSRKLFATASGGISWDRPLCTTHRPLRRPVQKTVLRAAARPSQPRSM